jgi:hypothetical protein
VRLTGSPIAIHRESHIQYLKYRRTEDPHSVQVASADERPGTRLVGLLDVNEELFPADVKRQAFAPEATIFDLT